MARHDSTTLDSDAGLSDSSHDELTRLDFARRGIAARRRRLRRRVAWAAIAFGLLVLLWFAPSLIANSPLQGRILSAALSDFEGSISIGSASVGWLSPIAARDIAAVDASGQPLAQVKAVHCEKSLLALLSNQRQLGTLRVDQPQVFLALNESGSNWQTALAGFMKASDEPSAPPELAIEIVNGAVTVTDSVGEQTWQIDRLNAAVRMPTAAEPGYSAKLAAQIANATSPTPSRPAVGKFFADITWQPAANLGDGQIAVQLDGLPLDAAQSLFSRFMPNGELAGAVSGQALCRWNDAGDDIEIEVRELAAAKFSLHAPAWLGSDTLRAEHWKTRGQARLAGGRWQIAAWSFESDIGSLEARGVFDPAWLADGRPWTSLLADLQQQPLQATARLDAARLAATLPSTLRIRPTTQITSGELLARLQTTAGTAPSFTAHVEAANVAARENGRDFAWQQPIVIDANFRQTEAGPVIEQLTCNAEFLNVSARGTLTQGSATVQGDLDRLAAEAGRLIDLGGLQLAGRLDGNFDWGSQPNGWLAGSGKLTLQDFELVAAGGLPWREKQLEILPTMEAITAENRISRIKNASVELVSAGDRFRADLLQPVDNPAANSAWPVKMQLTGDMATWLPRLQPLVDLGQARGSGRLNLNATATIAGDAIAAQSVAFEVADLKFNGLAGLAIDEPAVRLDSSFDWNGATRSLAASATTFTSSTVAFRADKVNLRLPATGPAVSGVLSYRADLERLARIFASGQPTESRVVGAVTGGISASHEADVTKVKWSADVQNLAYQTRVSPAAGAQFGAAGAAGSAGPPSVANVSTAAARSPWTDVWREAAVSLGGSNAYDRGRDRLTVDEFTATAESLNLTARGQIDKVSSQRQADLKGDIGYDLKQLCDRLRGQLGPNVQLVGQEKGSFELKGPLSLTAVPPATSSPSAPNTENRTPKTAVPLFSPDLTGRLNLGWESAQVYGLPIGRGVADVRLGQSVVQVSPLVIPVSGGKLHLAPTLDCRSQNAVLTLPPGPLAENIALTPELCRSWLMYVAPLLADATRAEGRFSVSLARAAIPVFDHTRMDMSGQFAVQQGQVGPGPLAQEFLGYVSQVRALTAGQPLANPNQPNAAAVWLTVPQQNLPFEVREGRVHHRGFTVQAQDVVLRTSGSVGLDQTLALAAEVPIRDSWVAGKPLLAGLQGTSLQIPVGGSFAKPQLDTRALADLNRQMLQGAASRALENELNRGLQRLFQPKPQTP